MRRTIAAMRAKCTTVDAFLEAYSTVDSTLGVWIDATVSVAHPMDMMAISGPRELGRPRRLRNGRGEDLTQRARVLRGHDRDWWVFPLQVRDGHRHAVTHYVEPAGAEALGLMRPFRHGFEMGVGMGNPGEGVVAAGTLILQLPANTIVTRVDPIPDDHRRVHGRPTLMWGTGLRFPHHPRLTVRWS
jgi:hypothetical protein